METFALRMRAARVAAGMTQKQLAHRLDWKPIKVSIYECGRRNPSPAIGIVIALALHVDPLWLREGIHSREVRP